MSNRPNRVRLTRRTLVNDYKLARGCSDCGLKPKIAMVLDFDHRDGKAKVANVSEMLGWPIDKVWAEIEKCDVVCANCHRVRTWFRLGGKE